MKARHLFLLTLGVLLVAWQTACKRIEVRARLPPVSTMGGQGPMVEAEPRIKVASLGGKMWIIEHPDGRTEIVTDDEKSFDDGTGLIEKVVSWFKGAEISGDYFAAKRAADAGAVATDQLKISGENAAANQAGELATLQEMNRSAEALAP